MAIDVVLSENKKVGVVIFYKEDAVLLEKVIKRAINTWHPEPPAELLDALAKLQEMQT
jgi:hypothetical protein